MGLLEGVVLGDEVAARVDDGFVVGRDGESGGEEELLVEDELELVFGPGSLGEDRPQSLLPLEAVFPGSWQ